MSNKILKTTGSGILGFERISEWEIVEESHGLIKIVEVHPGASLGRELAKNGFDIKRVSIESTIDYDLAQFYLLNSLVACESYDKELANASDNAWYVLTIAGNSSTMNTRAPVIIENGSIEQILTDRGSVWESCSSGAEEN